MAANDEFFLGYLLGSSTNGDDDGTGLLIVLEIVTIGIPFLVLGYETAEAISDVLIIKILFLVLGLVAMRLYSKLIIFSVRDFTLSITRNLNEKIQMTVFVCLICFVFLANAYAFLKIEQSMDFLYDNKALTKTIEIYEYVFAGKEA